MPMKRGYGRVCRHVSRPVWLLPASMGIERLLGSMQAAASRAAYRSVGGSPSLPYIPACSQPWGKQGGGLGHNQRYTVAGLLAVFRPRMGWVVELFWRAAYSQANRFCLRPASMFSRGIGLSSKGGWQLYIPTTWDNKAGCWLRVNSRWCYGSLLLPVLLGLPPRHGILNIRQELGHAACSDPT